MCITLYSYSARNNNSQHYGNRREEDSGRCVLLAIVYLFPVSESSDISLVTGGIGGTLHVMEHDIHTLYEWVGGVGVSGWGEGV